MEYRLLINEYEDKFDKQIDEILSLRKQNENSQKQLFHQREKNKFKLFDLQKRLNNQEKQQASQDDLVQSLMKELKMKREETEFKKENDTLLEANKEFVMNSGKGKYFRANKIKNEAYEKFIDKQSDEILSLRKQLSAVQQELFVEREPSDLQKKLNDQEQEQLSRMYTIDRASGSTPNHKIEINMESQKENEDLQKKHEELQKEYKILESKYKDQKWWHQEFLHTQEAFYQERNKMQKEANQKQIKDTLNGPLNVETQKLFGEMLFLQKQLSEERESFAVKRKSFQKQLCEEKEQLFEEKESLKTRLNDHEQERVKQIAEIKEKNNALAKTKKEFLLQKKQSTEVFSKKSEVLSKDDTSIRYY